MIYLKSYNINMSTIKIMCRYCMAPIHSGCPRGGIFDLSLTIGELE